MYHFVAWISFILRFYYIENIGAGLPFQWQFFVDNYFPMVIYAMVGIFFGRSHAIVKSLMYLIFYWVYADLINMIKHDFFSFWSIPQIAVLCFAIWLPFRLKFSESIFYSDYN
jgi:hypothetical protein